MKKKIIIKDEGIISISKTKNDSIQIAVNAEGCEFLKSVLDDLLEDKTYVFDYDSGTGYDCGILSKNSLGIIIVRKDF